MDNKITKKRLGNFLAYDWILITIMIVVAVVFMELIFSVARVRLTPGQSFSIYYDELVVSTNQDGFEQLLEDDKTFSYDVLEVTQEVLIKDNNMLYLRLTTMEGDAIITDDKLIESGEYSATKGRSVIDVYNIYDMDELYNDAVAYLLGFVKDSEANKYQPVENVPKQDKYPIVPEYSDLDEGKIDSNFVERMRGDNRFRAKDKNEAGKILERQRIEKLCEEVKQFKYLLDLDEALYESSGKTQSYFTYYTKGKQAAELAVNTKEEAEKKDAYEKNRDNNLAKYGREEARYALKVDMLKNGAHSANEFFRHSENTEGQASDVIVEIFDFKNFQVDLQYESIAFLNTIVRNCSNLYN